MESRRSEKKNSKKIIRKAMIAKKLTALGMAVVLVFSLAACGAADNGKLSSDTVKLKAAAMGDENVYKERVLGCPVGWEDCVQKFSVQLFQQAYAQQSGADRDNQDKADAAQSGSGFVLSPASVLTALLMAEEGADGETAAQIQEAVGSEVFYAREAFQQILNAKGEGTQVNTANSVWLRDDPNLQVQESFLAAMQQLFEAEVFSADFDKKTVKDINQWCKTNTKGRIEKILNEPISPQTMLYLINALTFDGKWQSPYKDYQVGDADFTAADGSVQTAEMMYGTEYTYLENDLATGFVKPYADGYSFVALLPHEGLSMADFVKGLSKDTFARAWKVEKETPVETGLPKFKTESGAELSEVLRTMGIRDLFDADRADLHRTATTPEGNLFVSKILHKAFIETDTEGTKAAAVTAAVDECGSAAPSEMKRVILDRPFFYAIIEEETGIPLFMGTVERMH